jgi:predicted nuclease with TOPRIM domain
MSDTPISDSTPHNVAELGMLCRRLERELNVANERIKRLEDSVSYWNDRYNDLNHKVQNRDNY